MEMEQKQVVMIGHDEILVHKLQQGYTPEITFLVAENSKQFENIAPIASQYHQINNVVTIYILRTLLVNSQQQ